MPEPQRPRTSASNLEVCLLTEKVPKLQTYLHAIVEPRFNVTDMRTILQRPKAQEGRGPRNITQEYRAHSGASRLDPIASGNHSQIVVVMGYKRGRGVELVLVGVGCGRQAVARVAGGDQFHHTCISIQFSSKVDIAQSSTITSRIGCDHRTRL